VFDVEIEAHVYEQGNSQERESEEGKPIHPFLNGLKAVEEFLLLPRIAVGGFAHRFQLILQALQQRILLQKLISQSPVLHLDFGQSFLNGLKVHWRRRRGHLRVRGEYIRYGGADISVKKGQNALDIRQRRSQCAGGALQAGRPLRWRRRHGQRALWRMRGGPEALRIA
jgi:hypothetical protein